MQFFYITTGEGVMSCRSIQYMNHIMGPKVISLAIPLQKYLRVTIIIDIHRE